MRIKDIVQNGGMVVTALWTAATTTADIAGVIDKPLLLKWSPLVGLLLFFGLVIWRLNDLTQHIKRLEEVCPSIEVTPKWEATRACLSVKNGGEHRASFQVKVLGLSAPSLTMTDAGRDLQHILPYDARWKEYIDEPSYDLIGGDNYDIELLKTDGLCEDGKEGLEIYTANETHRGRVSVGEEISVTLKVITEPKPKRPFQRSFRLHFDGAGHWDKFEEVK